MAATARAAGYRADFVAYTLFGELDMDAAGNEKRIARRTPQVEIQVTRCGWEGAWRREGLLAYGQLYCREIDAALLRGFNPALRFVVDGTLSAGAPLCRFLYPDGRLGAAELIRYQWGRWRLGAGSIRPFAFHVGELYGVLAAVLVERSGEAGRAAAAAAEATFREKYEVGPH